MTYIQDPPNTVKVELTKGCNLRCSMCGIAAIQEKQGRGYEFMTVATAERIAAGVKRAGWNSKFEFALRGEPLLNPQAPEIIAVFRKALPRAQIMVTSNAIPLLKPPGVEANITRLFEAGVNILALDDYAASKKATTQVREMAERQAIANAWKTHDYMTGHTEFSPYHRGKASQRVVIIIEDFEAASRDQRAVGTKKVNNHTGCGSPPLAEPLQQRCARPFREMVFRVDGHVALCCNEWRDYFQVTSAETKRGGLDVEATWSGPELTAARKRLMQARRDFNPCKGCNERTMRNGLLPDRMGQRPMPEETAADRAALRKALMKGPYEVPVLRPWEK